MRAARQAALDLAGGSAAGIIPEPSRLGSLGTGDLLPPGPYTVGLTTWEGGDGEWYEGLPYLVRCSTGQAVAGHVPSLEIAEAIADALNWRFPA